MGAHSRKCDWCGGGAAIVREMQPLNSAYQYWCAECAQALIIKGDPIETYRELEGEPIYGRLLEEHCTLKRVYSFATACGGGGQGRGAGGAGGTVARRR